MKTKMLFTALITLGLAGFSLPLAYGQTQSVQKTTTTSSAQTTAVRKTFKPVKASETELKTINAALSAKTITRTQPTVSTTSMIKPIDVTSPVKNEVWKAGKEYPIKWSRASKDVKISLISPATKNKPRENYQITRETPNTGTYTFKVPNECLIGSQAYVQVESLDGKESGASHGISVYTQPVDLECQIVDAKIVWSSTNYIIYYESNQWLEFNFMMRSKGTRFPVTITEILVRVIKQPEGVVAYQEIFGFSDIYDDYWYHLPEPIKINIRDKSGWFFPGAQGTSINLQSGSYLVEVKLDPQNLLNENEQTHDDNKSVNSWIIR